MPLNNPDTVFTYRGVTIQLKTARQGRNPAATLTDDGIVDHVAVRLAATGERRVALTGREIICAVHRMAVDGHDDDTIADRLGTTDRSVVRIRQRHGIPAAYTTGQTRPTGSRKQWHAA